MDMDMDMYQHTLSQEGYLTASSTEEPLLRVSNCVHTKNIYIIKERKYQKEKLHDEEKKVIYEGKII